MSELEEQITYFKFPAVQRRVFDQNYLDTVIVQLRYPTYLRLKEEEPRDIAEAIRELFPLYEPGRQVQMTPMGTESQPVYKFATRRRDPVCEITASHLALTAKKYASFETFTDQLSFLIERVIPIVDTTFFTRVGLRFINSVSGMKSTGDDIYDWINSDLVKPVGAGEIGTISNMRNELEGSLQNGGGYTFRYGLSPPSPDGRKFVLDWDYFKEDVEVSDSIGVLEEFHNLHFPFFWWALGDGAKRALEDGRACK